MDVSSAVALIQALAPEDEVQGMLAIQTACLDADVANVLSRLYSHSLETRTTVPANAAAKLQRAFQSTIKLYDALKRGHRQVIRIERMEVQASGQAVVGQFVAKREAFRLEPSSPDEAISRGMTT